MPVDIFCERMEDDISVNWCCKGRDIERGQKCGIYENERGVYGERTPDEVRDMGNVGET